MSRSHRLASYRNPPLHEVVLGVQFPPIPGYTSVDSNRIWEPFRQEFESVQELPTLEPKFETYGWPIAQMGPQFVVRPSAMPNRLWFVSKDKSHLVQFQSDRFIANWRKQTEGDPYPRFEALSARFYQNLIALEKVLKSFHGYVFDINQAEISYINIIPVQEYSQLHDWVKVWAGRTINLESISMNFSEVVNDSKGIPIARLYYNIDSVVVDENTARAFRFTISFRGKPAGNDIGSALLFLAIGREQLVCRFGEMTTDSAQQFWERAE